MKRRDLQAAVYGVASYNICDALSISATVIHAHAQGSDYTQLVKLFLEKC